MSPLHTLAHIIIIMISTLSVSVSPSSTLDPKQLTALQSIGLPTSRDPCSSSLNTNNYTACDSSAPFRHLVALTLANCSSSDLDLSSTALRSLSTLRSLSLLDCPGPHLRHPLPSPLSSSLISFTFILTSATPSSRSHLSGVWLSRLTNLTNLRLLSAPVAASAPFVFLSQMPHLLTATASGCNLTGRVPHHWHSLNLTLLDLSFNHLEGSLPASIGTLGSLQSLNLTSNALDGPLPHTIGELVSLKNLSLSSNSFSGSLPESIGELPELAHLDLSSNRLNGSLPAFLAEMKSLKHLNLENNDFQGVMPFNASFIRRLAVFKIGGNSDLCYNHSLISSKMELGISPCDKYGLPVSPPADKSTKSRSSSDYDDDGSDDDGDDEGESGSKKSNGGGHHGPNRLVLAVAIGLSCLVFLVIFLVCVSKCCS